MGVYHGFLRDENGHFSQFDVPNALATEFYDINNLGHITGDILDTNGVIRKFLLVNNVIDPKIEFPGAAPVTILLNRKRPVINDSGQIASAFFDAQGACHAYFLDDGVFTQYDISGATVTEFLGINDNNRVVGSYNLGGVLRGFVAQLPQ
jgi:hypothetical protein